MRWWLHPVRVVTELVDAFTTGIAVAAAEAFDRADDPADSDVTELPGADLPRPDGGWDAA